MVGLGPGDPELVTVKAKKVIESSRLIFVPSMKSDLSSRAYHTALPTSQKVPQLFRCIFLISPILDFQKLSNRMLIR